MTLTVGSLFSGIGGLELGLERAGFSLRWHSEIDPYCVRVHAKHWPHVPNLGDVTQIDWSSVEPVDLICGGYPCQPFSIAGRRAGADDDRHLWPYFADALRVLRPRLALLENVPGHLSMGFGDVLGDLDSLGYDTEWDCIPAASVGAPHLRDRVFCVAWDRTQLGRALADRDDGRPLNPVRPGRDAPRDGSEDVADADGAFGCKSRSAGEAVPRPSAVERSGRRGESNAPVLADSEGIGWSRCLVSRQDVEHDGPELAHGDARARGDRTGWAAEPDVGRVAHGVPSRVDRLRGLGNAVVPQVAEYVGRRILEAVA